MHDNSEIKKYTCLNLNSRSFTNFIDYSKYFHKFLDT